MSTAMRSLQGPGALHAEKGTGRFQTRIVPAQQAMALERQGVHPLLARLFAARGLEPTDVGPKGLQHLLHPKGLLGIDSAAQILADALEAQARIVVVADYDCDGATACAVAVRGLRMLAVAMAPTMGLEPAEARQAARECIDFIVPNRFEYGYGLSPDVVHLAAQSHPDLLVTVDNGIASIEGVEQANALGIGVLVTDHHLPAQSLPEALAIVNPNQPGCGFESKHIAGVGVMFYVLMATRAELRSRGHFDEKNQPRLDTLLDLVAIGTVADVVRLDANNRLLVAQGLKRIRAGQIHAGVAALFQAAGKEPRTATTTDIGFGLGPRLNAAGRLADMSLGIQTLLTDDPGEAMELARTLNAINQERQKIEGEMKETALTLLEGFDAGANASIVVHHSDWHQGVIGIVASRLKEKFYRPTIALAPGGDGVWKGSGRSIPGVHLRDVLDWVVKQLPADAVPKFGGHAMAAGLTLHAHALEAFKQAFEKAVRHFADNDALTHRVVTDGSLPVQFCSALTVDMLSDVVWGQGFPAPVFDDEFEVISQRLLKEAHSKLVLRRDNVQFTALWWNMIDPLPKKLRLAYRLEKDTFTGGGAIQLIVEQGEPA